MTCVYMRSEVKRDDTTALNKTTNRTCIGYLAENCYLMGEGMTLLMTEDVKLLRRIMSITWYNSGR